MSGGLHSVEIVEALRQDGATIAAMHARLFDEPWDPRSVARLIDHPAALAMLARTIETDATAGFVIAHVAADEAEILTIGVAPEWQRRGTARLLLHKLEERAAARGARKLYADVATDNEPAIALYAGLGFEPMGRRKGYYVRRTTAPSDAVLLAKAL
jgi:ribosomal-protein-alanine N-acetyltransferase